MFPLRDLQRSEIRSAAADVLQKDVDRNRTGSLAKCHTVLGVPLLLLTLMGDPREDV